MPGKINTSVIFFFLFFNFCSGPQKSERIFVLSSDTPAAAAFRIKNEGKKDALFVLKMNRGLFFSSVEEILDAVKNMKEEYANEPGERKAWRFVKNNICHGFAFKAHPWMHNPVVMLNSIGFGKCGEQAEALAVIWRMFGFKTKIWSLNGHVVPEVFAGNKWQMYDPSLQVYYKDNNGRVCSVEELAVTPDLITSPAEPLQFNAVGIFISAMRYSRLTAGLYSTMNDNREYSHPLPDDTNSYKFTICLPPGGSFEFPVFVNRGFIPGIHFFYDPRMNARLTVPADWRGEIKIPLAISSITGNGNIELNEKKFSVASPELEKQLKDFSEFNYCLNFYEPHGNIEVLYLINGILYEPGKQNVLKISGTNIGRVKAEMMESKDDTAEIYGEKDLSGKQAEVKKRINENIDEYEKHKELFDKCFTPFVPEWSLTENIIRRIDCCMESNFKGSGNPVKKGYIQKINALMQILSASINEKKLFHIIDKPQGFIATLTYLEYYSEEELRELLFAKPEALGINK